jgi:putative ABC transport system substrate-binding protein
MRRKKSRKTLMANRHFSPKAKPRFKPLCDQAGIPIYAYHRNAVEHSAIAALASDYYVIAEQLVVPMALRVLREHVSPGTFPAAFLEDHLIFINLTEANRLGLQIPPSIVQRATKVY